MQARDRTATIGGAPHLFPRTDSHVTYRPLIEPQGRKGVLDEDALAPTNCLQHTPFCLRHGYRRPPHKLPRYLSTSISMRRQLVCQYAHKYQSTTKYPVISCIVCKLETAYTGNDEASLPHTWPNNMDSGAQVFIRSRMVSSIQPTAQPHGLRSGTSPPTASARLDSTCQPCSRPMREGHTRSPGSKSWATARSTHTFL